MFSGQNKIRVKAICLFQDGDYIFVSKAYDSVKDNYYYRPIGGKTEFGEYTNQTIIREIKEELNAEIINLQQVKVVEDIFVCDGFDGHEIMFIYKADFKDKSFYEKKEYEIVEPSGEKFTASWIKTSEFTSGNLRLVPEELNKWELLKTSVFRSLP